MKRDILDHKIFHSLIRSDKVTPAERWLGYFLGPFSVVLLNSILNNYLNVYYTDVAGLGGLWGGWFLSVFPIVVKMLDAMTFILMGLLVDRFQSRQGKARPWILLSAPLLVASMILLFTSPTGNSFATALWIFISYNLFYSVAYTAYNTCHTLMVPLSTKDMQERGRLSVLTNSQGMLSGMIVAVMFPTFIVPAMGIVRGRWIAVMTFIALTAFPFILMEYYFTRERVTEHAHEEGSRSLRRQLCLCLKSRRWKTFMIYLILIHLTSCLSQSATFYYCNWVLGSYNDGYTQALFFAVGNAALGPGVFLCRPVCKKLGRENAMAGGFLLAAAGTAVCLLNPHSLIQVLIGQIIKSIGLIPSTYMVTAMLGDALDDVENHTGTRCDGFSSSVYNVIYTLATGAALCILNFGLMQCGYSAPSAGIVPVQNDTVQAFLTFSAIGCQTLVYPFAALLLKLGGTHTEKRI